MVPTEAPAPVSAPVKAAAPGPRSVDSYPGTIKPGFSGPLALYRPSHQFLFYLKKPEFIFRDLKPKRLTDVDYVLLYKTNKDIHYDIVCQRQMLETA